jgi:hypothetical protein
VTSPHVQIDPQDAAIIDAIAEHMRRILDAFRSFGREYPTWKVADESQLGKERERLLRHIGPGGAWTPHAADYVSDAGLLFLLAQSDHLHVLRQIYSSYAGLMFGLGPPARSLLELNGYVYWLLHPDVQSIRTRASRALLSRLNDATRELSVAKDLGAPDRHLSPVGQLVRELKDQVPKQFYPSEIGRDKQGRLILRGEKHPGPGEALRYLSVEDAEAWNSRGAYSFLSNASHPTLHVITDTIQGDHEGRPAHFGHSDTRYQYRLARMAMAGFLSTWQIVAAYRGLDQEPSRQLSREIDDLPAP